MAAPLSETSSDRKTNRGGSPIASGGARREQTPHPLAGRQTTGEGGTDSKKEGGHGVTEECGGEEARAESGSRESGRQGGGRAEARATGRSERHVTWEAAREGWGKTRRACERAQR